MIDLAPAILLLLFILILYIAYKILKLALKTGLAGVVGGITYFVISEFTRVNFSFGMLISAVVLSSGIYLAIQIWNFLDIRD